MKELDTLDDLDHYYYEALIIYSIFIIFMILNLIKNVYRLLSIFREKPALVESVFNYADEFEKAYAATLQKQKQLLDAEGYNEIPEEAFNTRRKKDTFEKIAQKEAMVK